MMPPPQQPVDPCNRNPPAQICCSLEAGCKSRPGVLCTHPRKPGGPSMKRSFPRLLLALLLVICPVMSFGQAVFGGISGTITDPSGAAITDAKITITETSKGVSYNTTTN